MLQNLKYKHQYCTINIKKNQTCKVLNESHQLSFEMDTKKQKNFEMMNVKRNVNEMDYANTIVETSAMVNQRQQFGNLKLKMQEKLRKLLSTLRKNTSLMHSYNTNLLSNQSELILRRIINNIEEITHMKDVRVSQENVKAVRSKLVAKSNEKRQILKELNEVRTELGSIYRDMKGANNRIPEKYLQLTRQEIELIEKEKCLMDKCAKIDEEEQHLLNYELSAAINDSYEKEKNYTNFIKMFGLVAAVLSSFLTLLGALIGHAHQQNRYDSLLKEFNSIVGQKITEPICNLLESLDEKK